MRQRLRLGVGDADAINKIFTKMKMKDRNFFFAIQTNDENRLSNVLWIHPRSVAAYEDFSDVISFDSTYLVNCYNMPFATFVGINHYRQSIILGCVMISHKDAKTYKWVFSTWLMAMRNRKPNAILTDQYESIRKAINEVMPRIIHKFCLWHIYMKLPKKPGPRTYFKEVKNKFYKVVYDSLTIETFESSWTYMTTKYGLENKEWFTKLYNDGRLWVPTFMNDTFWAGMLSTQISESMHAYFDGYVNRLSALKQFVEQYEIALWENFEKETKVNFKTMNTRIKCISPFHWERHFQEVYTHEIFLFMQEEIKRMWSCFLVQQRQDEVENKNVENGLETIKIMERVMIEARYWKEHYYIVRYKEDGIEFNCNCRQFEWKGGLCGHVLKVMIEIDVRVVNDRYILRRWRKDIFRHYTRIKLHRMYPQMTLEYQRFHSLEILFLEAADMAMSDSDKFAFMTNALNSLNQNLKNMGSTRIGDSSYARSNVDNGEFIAEQGILDPIVTRSRGRPPLNRI